MAPAQTSAVFSRPLPIWMVFQALVKLSQRSFLGRAQGLYEYSRRDLKTKKKGSTRGTIAARARTARTTVTASWPALKRAPKIRVVMALIPAPLPGAARRTAGS